MYNKVTAADIAALEAIVGQQNVLTGEAINPDYAHDELGGICCMPEYVRSRRIMCSCWGCLTASRARTRPQWWAQ